MLHEPLQVCFTAQAMLPYRNTNPTKFDERERKGFSPISPNLVFFALPAASAVHLSPAKLSMQNHLTSELLRFLSRMAASKPTSWLSQCFHFLSHLVHTSGP